jgi:hypothetical protein
MGDQFSKEYWPSEDRDLNHHIPRAGSSGPERKINPMEVTESALAHGQIGSVPWALVERGDGLVLAIGDLNVPIDTPAETGQAARFLQLMNKAIFQQIVRQQARKSEG